MATKKKRRSEMLQKNPLAVVVSELLSSSSPLVRMFQLNKKSFKGHIAASKNKKRANELK